MHPVTGASRCHPVPPVLTAHIQSAATCGFILPSYAIIRTGSFTLYILFLLLISPNRDTRVFIHCKGDSLGEHNLAIEREEINGGDAVTPHMNVIPEKH